MTAKRARRPKSSALAFLTNLLKAWLEFVRYNRAVRFQRRAYLSSDLIIYCLKKAARETAMGQRVSIAVETGYGKMTISVDTEAQSPALTKEDELHQMWLRARHDKGGE